MKLDGFGPFVRDMPTMVRFYRDVLGFEIKKEEDATHVYLEKDGTLFLRYRRTDFEKMVVDVVGSTNESVLERVVLPVERVFGESTSLSGSGNASSFATLNTLRRPPAHTPNGSSH